MIEQIFKAILLGVIEGVTEFLPVSSTGHLILLVDILNFEAPPGKIFEVVIQLGAILAICLVFKERVLNVALHMHDSSKTRRFVGLILLAFIPAAIIGLMAHSYIKEVLFSPIVVSSMLIIGGILIFIVEKFKPEATTFSVDDITKKQALAIGFFQALAMIPGTSRSGSTMMGSLLMKIDRKTAAEFSFLLAIPTMTAATAYDIYKNFDVLSLDDTVLIVTGFVSAFVAAWFSVRWLLAFLSNHDFIIFAWYRIILGGVMLLFLL